MPPKWRGTLTTYDSLVDSQSCSAVVEGWWWWRIEYTWCPIPPGYWGNCFVSLSGYVHNLLLPHYWGTRHSTPSPRACCIYWGWSGVLHDCMIYHHSTPRCRGRDIPAGHHGHSLNHLIEMDGCIRAHQGPPGESWDSCNSLKCSYLSFLRITRTTRISF